MVLAAPTRIGPPGGKGAVVAPRQADGTGDLVNTATASSQETPDVRPSPTAACVVWNDASVGTGNGAAGDSSDLAVKGQVFDAGGGKVGGEFLVNVATESQQAISGNVGSGPQRALVALPDGGFVVVWTDFSHGVGGATGDVIGRAVKARVFDSDGGARSDEILVNTAVNGEQRFPTLAVLDNGGFVITWEDYSQGVGGASGDPDASAVKAQVFDADGDKVGGEILVNSSTKSYQETPAVVGLPGAVSRSPGETPARVGGATGDSDHLAVKVRCSMPAETGSATRSWPMATLGSQGHPWWPTWAGPVLRHMVRRRRQADVKAQVFEVRPEVSAAAVALDYDEGAQIAVATGVTVSAD